MDGRPRPTSPLLGQGNSRTRPRNPLSKSRRGNCDVLWRRLSKCSRLRCGPKDGLHQRLVTHRRLQGPDHGELGNHPVAGTRWLSILSALLSRGNEALGETSYSKGRQTKENGG